MHPLCPDASGKQLGHVDASEWIFSLQVQLKHVELIESPEELVTDDVRVPPAPSARVPSMLSSIAQSIDIMQVRITRSRLAGEPADILIQPRLGGMGIFDFHRAAPAIEEGRAAVEYMLPAIRARLGIE